MVVGIDCIRQDLLLSSIHSLAIIFRYFRRMSDLVPPLHRLRSIAFTNKSDSYFVHFADIFTSAKDFTLLVYYVQ